VATYRDPLRLLVRYASRAPSENRVVSTCVTSTETSCSIPRSRRARTRDGPRTRNARLTAIRSFFRHVAASDPGALAIAQRVLDIPNKRTILQAPRHLSATAIDALLDTPDQQTTLGRRDYAFLLFLARTGARVSEAVGLDAADVRLARPPHVLLRGKGRKERVLPMAPISREHWSDCTRSVVSAAMSESLSLSVPVVAAHAVWCDPCGSSCGATCHRARTRFARAKVSPHLFRHSLAMRLLQSGSDLVTIQAWLGHASVLTTHRYAEAIR